MSTVATLVTLIGYLAVAAWIVVLITFLRILAMMPGVGFIAGANILGMWRFDRVEQHAGQGVRPLIRTYRLGFIAFFIFVALAIALGVAAAVLNQP